MKFCPTGAGFDRKQNEMKNSPVDARVRPEKAEEKKKRDRNRIMKILLITQSPPGRKQNSNVVIE